MISAQSHKSATTKLSDLPLSERLNFLLTNRIPRRWATLFMGKISRIENPWFVKIAIWFWQSFSNLNLDEAEKKTFKSINDCFTRKLKDGLRPFDTASDYVASPCDAIVGAYGKLRNGLVYQAKGFPYELEDLIPESNIAAHYKNGNFITLRLKADFYHRFHAPIQSSVDQVVYISGDTWNVNPIAVKTIERLFCKNERALIQLSSNNNDSKIALVPVAAILVASMKIHCIDHELNVRYQGPSHFEPQVNVKKGEEMGFFQHGSTIILFTDEKYSFLPNLSEGKQIKAGESILKFNLHGVETRN